MYTNHNHLWVEAYLDTKYDGSKLDKKSQMWYYTFGH